MTNDKKYVSGAIGYYLPLNKVGQNFFPFIPELKGRTILYIDFCPTLTSGIQRTQTINSDLSGTLNLMEHGTNNLFIKDCAVKEFAQPYNFGKRLPINKVVDFENSFVNCAQNPSGGYFFVFWYYDEKVANKTAENEQTDLIGFEVVTNSRNRNYSLGRYYFGENRTLVRKKYANLFVQNFQNNPKSPNGYEINNYINEAFVTLQNNNYMFIKDVPLVLFCQQGWTEVLTLQNVEIDFYQSYVTMPNAGDVLNNSCIFITAQVQREEVAYV